MNATVRSITKSRILILQNFPVEGLGLYKTRLQELGIDHDIVHAYAGESFPRLDHYGAIIIGGTPVSANEIHRYDFLMKEERFLKKALDRGKSILGICFGAQLLAMLLGAAVEKNPVMEIGSYQVSLTAAGRQDPLFREFPETFPVFHWHGDTFAIPPGASRLVTGRGCPNQAFRAGPAVGLQFHLETTAAEARSWADAYRDELRTVAKSKARVIDECREHEPVMARLAGLLLDNFLAGAAKGLDNKGGLL
jgi:GMP synthase-like glutamine amidotransferase